MTHSPFRIALLLGVTALGIGATLYLLNAPSPTPPAPATPTPDTPAAHNLPSDKIRYTEVSASHFVTDTLMKHDDPKRWRQLAAAYLDIYGRDEAMGLLVALREQAQYPSKQARATAVAGVVRELLELAGEPDFTRLIDTYDAAHALERSLDDDTLNADELARLDAWATETLNDIAAQQYNVYDPVERQMGNAEDYLAVQCVRWLHGRDLPVPDRAVAHLRHRVPVSELHAPEIEAVLKTLPAKP